MKSNAVYFWKFLYSFVIVFFHFYLATKEHFISGRYGVDFYLLAAGFFLFSKFIKENSGENIVLTTPYSFLKNRFARFFPWSLAGFLFAAVVVRGYISPVQSFGKLMDCFSGDIWEILLINMNGMNNDKSLLNGPAWTLSSMLIAQFFIWSCLYHYKDRFTDLFMPLTIVIGLGVWRFIPSASIKAWMGFTTFGTFRAWIVLCLGYYAVRLAEHMKKTDYNSKGKLLLTAAELACHAFALWVIMSRDSRNYQWCCILAFLLATSIEMSGHSKFNELLNRFKFVGFLGELSMCIYLTHGSVLRIYQKLYPEPYVMYGHKFEFLFFVLVASFAMYFATKLLVSGWKTVRLRMRSCLTNRNTAVPLG